MRFILAAILGAHGIAHFVGFVFSWQIATLAELPYKTTILADRIDVGDGGIRVVGVLWLTVGLGFLAAAAAVGAHAPWALPFTFIMVLASVPLCAIGWPDARIGLAVNIGILALLLLGTRWPLAALLR
jgi:hypothetical protein